METTVANDAVLGALVGGAMLAFGMFPLALVAGVVVYLNKGAKAAAVAVSVMLVGLPLLGAVAGGIIASLG